MLANILKQINEAEEEADNIIARANKDAQEIEKEMFITIEKISADADIDIAKTVYNLPKVQAPTAKVVELKVESNKMQEAVALITTSFVSEFE